MNKSLSSRLRLESVVRVFFPSYQSHAWEVTAQNWDVPARLMMTAREE